MIAYGVNAKEKKVNHGYKSSNTDPAATGSRGQLRYHRRRRRDAILLGEAFSGSHEKPLLFFLHEELNWVGWQVELFEKGARLVIGGSRFSVLFVGEVEGGPAVEDHSEKSCVLFSH